jgi:hypothetical protein
MRYISVIITHNVKFFMVQEGRSPFLLWFSMFTANFLPRLLRLSAKH